MQEKRFDVSYPAYQADALIRALRNQQQDISEELKPALDDLYRVEVYLQGMELENAEPDREDNLTM